MAAFFRTLRFGIILERITPSNRIRNGTERDRVLILYNVAVLLTDEPKKAAGLGLGGVLFLFSMGLRAGGRASGIRATFRWRAGRGGLCGGRSLQSCVY